MIGWRAVEVELDALLSGSNACMKGPQLFMVCTALEQQTNSGTPAGSNALDCVRCFIKTMELLAKLLSVRKRARCWAQQEYSKRVAITLEAATTVLKHPSLGVNPVAAGKMARKLLGDTELLLLVAAAQREVAQLLTAPAQQQQQRQQQLDKGQAVMLLLAQRLLLWWLEAQRLWLNNPDRDTLARATTAAAAEGYYAYHVQAAELAAAVVQAAGPNCTPELFLTVAQVARTVSCCTGSPSGLSPVAAHAVVAHHTSAAYLRLVLTMLLVHSYRCNNAALAALPQPALQLLWQQLQALAAISITTTSSSAQEAAADAVVSQAPAEQQQLLRLFASIASLWKQLGMGGAHSLVQFADAVGKGGLTNLPRPATDSNSSSCPVPSAERDTQLKALCEWMQELDKTLSATVRQQGVLGPRGKQRQPALTRQHQQLLEAVCVELPRVLQRTALLCGEGQPLLIAAAVEAATAAVLSWRSARKAAGAEWQQQEAQQMLPEVLDCCLLLSAHLLGGVVWQHTGGAPQQQQQQQQQPSGLLFQVAASGRVVQSDSTAAKELRRAFSCKCSTGKVDCASSSSSSSSNSSSSSFSCVSLDCASLLAVKPMLACLGVTKVHWQDGMDRGPAVLMLLEVLARRVLPHHITCSKSSSSQHSSAAGQLLTELLNVGSDRGLMQALFAASLAQPQLQPRVVALSASLHKLYRSQGNSGQLGSMHTAAAAARRMILDLNETGVPDAVGRDLRTWRHMLAHWVVLLGRYCLEVGRWLHDWQREQQQKLQRLQTLSSTSSSMDGLGLSSSKLLGLLTASCEGGILKAVIVLEQAEWLLGYPSMQYVRALWETCSTEPESDEDDDDMGSISSGSGLEGDTSMGPASARAWQQWQGAAGQQPVPAYGSLAAEFAGLKGQCTDCIELCLSITKKTGERINKVKGADVRASTSSRSSSSSTSVGNGGDVSQMYDEERVFKECCAAEDAIGKASSVASAVRACLGFSGFAALGSELQAVGAGLCAKLPLPWLCNNPLCSSMGGASELQLVGGRSCVCGGCRVARYCGVHCQAAHWEQHKPVCRKLAAAAAPQAAAAAAGS